jgi:hypothetical protein
MSTKETFKEHLSFEMNSLAAKKARSALTDVGGKVHRKFSVENRAKGGKQVFFYFFFA